MWAGTLSYFAVKLFLKYSKLWKAYLNVTDRQTDRQMDGQTTCNLITTLYSVASRSKNEISNDIDKITLMSLNLAVRITVRYSVNCTISSKPRKTRVADRDALFLCGSWASWFIRSDSYICCYTDMVVKLLYKFTSLLTFFRWTVYVWSDVSSSRKLSCWFVFSNGCFTYYGTV